MLRLIPGPPRDAVLPALLALVALSELVLGRPNAWVAAAVVEIVACALLVGRRRHPLPLATAAFVVVLLLPWLGTQLNEVAAPILIGVVATFSLARWLPDLRGLVGVAVVLLVMVLDYVLVDPRVQNWSDVVFVTAIMGPPFVLGRVVRRLSDQGQLLLEQQELVKQQAARDERDRIARELHDVIAHSVSAMVVQVAAAQDLVVSDPDRAAHVLEDAARAGRKALGETGRLLQVIRDDAEELGLEPVPGLADVPELVRSFEDRGLRVDLHVDEQVPALPAGLDVSVYRIVQEALTNALRYASDGFAVVRMTGTPTSLLIHASNASAGTAGVGTGLGLVGMAERVSLFGGDLAYGPAPDGRFHLTATLPLTRRGEPA